jgi:hypothetical protein
VDAKAVPAPELVDSWEESLDEPASFNPERRDWSWRRIAHAHLPIENSESRLAQFKHDPMAALEGA